MNFFEPSNSHSNDLWNNQSLPHITGICCGIPPEKSNFHGRTTELDWLAVEVDRRNEIRVNNNWTLGSHVILVHGLPGVGKTQLIIKLLTRIFSSFTRHTIWLDASTEEALRNSFNRAAFKVGEYCKWNDANRRSLQSNFQVLQDRVYRDLVYMRNVGTLIVVDNVDFRNYTSFNSPLSSPSRPGSPSTPDSPPSSPGIKEFLPVPRHPDPKVVRPPIVILISRDDGKHVLTSYADVYSYDLRVRGFTPEESKSFLLKCLPSAASNKTEANLSKIAAAICGHVPDALDEVVRFVTGSLHGRSEYGLDEFIKEFQRDVIRHLGPAGAIRSGSDETVLSGIRLWDKYVANIERCCEDVNVGRIGVKIMECVTFFPPNCISSNILEHVMLKTKILEDVAKHGQTKCWSSCCSSSEGLNPRQVAKFFRKALEVLISRSLLDKSNDGRFATILTVKPLIQTSILSSMSSRVRSFIVLEILREFTPHLAETYPRKPNYTAVVETALFLKTRINECFSSNKMVENTVSFQEFSVVAQNAINNAELAKAMVDETIQGFRDSNSAMNEIMSYYAELKVRSYGSEDQLTQRMQHLLALTQWMNGNRKEAIELWNELWNTGGQGQERESRALVIGKLTWSIFQWREIFDDWAEWSKDLRKNTFFGGRKLSAKKAIGAADPAYEFIFTRTIKASKLKGQEDYFEKFLTLHPHSVSHEVSSPTLKGSLIIYSELAALTCDPSEDVKEQARAHLEMVRQSIAECVAKISIIAQNGGTFTSFTEKCKVLERAQSFQASMAWIPVQRDTLFMDHYCPVCKNPNYPDANKVFESTMFMLGPLGINMEKENS